MAIFIALGVSLLLGMGSHLVLATNSWPTDLLNAVMLVSNGAILLVTAMSHLFKPSLMARELGWESGGPFQSVVGFWNAGAGLICVISFWRGGDFLLAAAIVVSIFWAGAAGLHWRAVIARGERTRIATAAGETLLVLYTVVLVVLVYQPGLVPG